MVNRRYTLVAVGLAGWLGVGLPAFCAEDELMEAPKIIQSLSKDITLDRPGHAARARTPSVDLRVQFAFNSAELLPAGRRQLDELAMALASKALATWGFELAGHTDRVGSAEYNLRLSLDRANAVKQYLVVTHGLNGHRLLPIGLGASRLADPAHPEAAINRRVEVRRVALNPTPTADHEPHRVTPSGRLVTTP